MSSPQNINAGLDTGTGKQQRIDAACLFQAAVDRSQADDIKRQMDLDQLMELGCKVVKHPDCCAPCAANNDCERLPMHIQCRCRPEGFLVMLDEPIY